jgi:lactoylglutathione lyase
MELRLMVIRTGDPEKLADFYSNLGLAFEYHKHGNSPYHYSAYIGETVLEIYPLMKLQSEPDKTLRLGFNIDNFDEIIQILKEKKILFATEPMQTDFGHMAIIVDPDGRKIEIYKK